MHDLRLAVSRALVGADGQTNYLGLSTDRDLLIYMVKMVIRQANQFQFP